MKSETDIIEVDDRAPLPAAPSALRRVGRYDVEEIVATGGMGVVYRGTLRGDGGFSRPVAIKRLKESLGTDGRYVAMLIDEARICGRIRSPHVVEVLDLVHEGSEFFVIMPFVPGTSLDRLRQVADATPSAPIATEVAVGIVIQTLRGLHAAHETVDDAGVPLGIVHRDVSPSNIHVGADGVVRVIDFGIAKAAGRVQQATATGERKGKPSYMSPEQLMAGSVDKRSDIFSTGVVLAELLMAGRLFPNETLLGAMSRGDTLPKTLAPSRPSSGDPLGPYRAVLEAMLAVAPSMRPPTAAAAAEILVTLAPDAVDCARRWAMQLAPRGGTFDDPGDSFVQSAVEVSAPTGRRSSSLPSRRRRIGVMVIAGCAAAGAAAGATEAAAFWSTRSNEQRIDERQMATSTADPAPSPPEVRPPFAPAMSPTVVAPTVLGARGVATAGGGRVTVHGASAAAATSSKRSSTTAAAKPDCRVPFELAPDGTKIPKRACF